MAEDKSREINIIEYGTKKASQFAANPRNYRRHPQAQRKALKASRERVGWIAPVIENARTGYLIDGHERIWEALDEGDLDVPYVLVDVAPEDEGFVLATFDPIGAMAEIDEEKFRELFEEVETDAPAIQVLLDDLAKSVGELSEKYSRKIQAPIYEPSDIKPSITELYDDSKTKALCQEIEEAEDLTEAEREFLTIAAQRHTVIQFDKVAEYYAHSGPELQRLMEDSALVIIDFNRAIELGFVQVTKNIAAQVRDEYGEE